MASRDSDPFGEVEQVFPLLAPFVIVSLHGVEQQQQRQCIDHDENALEVEQRNKNRTADAVAEDEVEAVESWCDFGEQRGIGLEGREEKNNRGVDCHEDRDGTGVIEGADALARLVAQEQESGQDVGENEEKLDAQEISGNRLHAVEYKEKMKTIEGWQRPSGQR